MARIRALSLIFTVFGALGQNVHAADAKPTPAQPAVANSSEKVEHASASNPYSDPEMKWAQSPSPVAQEEEQVSQVTDSSGDKDKRVPGAAPETPFEEVTDTDHVVPTSFQNEAGPNQDLPPFSLGGVMVQVSDETWFKFHGFFQTRYVTGKHHSVSGERENNSGFSLARARLFFRGNLNPWLGTLLRVGATSSGSVNIEQAYADFRWREWALRVGQWYLPVFQEQALSPVSTLTLNPSAVGAVFDGGQTQGARLMWARERTRAQIALSDGLRSGFSEVGNPNVADIAMTVRVEHVMGASDFGRFNTGSSFRGEGFSALFGFGGHYQYGGDLENSAVELGSVNGDGTIESGGFSLQSVGSIVITEDVNQSRLIYAGMVAQAGYFVLPWTEVYGRYEALLSQSLGDSGNIEYKPFRGLTAGLSQYFWPERGLRLQGDFVYYFDPTVDTLIADNPNGGVVISAGPQWTVRTQLNVLF